jgi:hypothetical protein
MVKVGIQGQAHQDSEDRDCEKHADQYSGAAETISEHSADRSQQSSQQHEPGSSRAGVSRGESE